MALLALGPHIFEIVGLNYQKLERESQAVWPAIKRFGGHAARQFTGLGPDSQTVNGLLFPDEFGGRGEYEAIRATQSRGSPVMMVGFSGATLGRVFGLVIIETVSDTQFHIDRSGAGKQLEFSVTVSPYGGSAFGGLF